MRKKAQGISINVIIVAALALLVLVLVALIFTGRLTFFRDKSALCENNGGVCKNVCDTDAGETRTLLFPCEDKNQVCCLMGSGS